MDTSAPAHHAKAGLRKTSADQGRTLQSSDGPLPQKRKASSHVARLPKIQRHDGVVARIDAVSSPLTSRTTCHATPEGSKIELLENNFSKRSTSQARELLDTAPATTSQTMAALLWQKDLTRVQALTVKDVKLVRAIISTGAKRKCFRRIVEGFQNTTLETMEKDYSKEQLEKMTAVLLGKDLARVQTLTVEDIKLLEDIAGLETRPQATPGVIQAYYSGSLKASAPAPKTPKMYKVDAHSFLRNKQQWGAEWQLDEKLVTDWKTKLGTEADGVLQEMENVLQAKMTAGGSGRMVSIVAGGQKSSMGKKRISSAKQRRV